MKTKYRYILPLVLIMIIQPALWAQKSLQKARTLKNNFDYSLAVQYYQSHFKIHQPSPDEAREVAETYYRINDMPMAEKWLEKAVLSASKTPADVLNYAHILRSNGKYEDAAAQYRDYALLSPENSKRANDWAKACSDAQNWIKDPTHFSVNNQEAFNSPYADFGLMPYNNGYLITSDREIAGKAYNSNNIYGWTGKPYLNLFFIDDKNQIQPLKYINNDFHNGPSVFDPLGKTLYYTRTKMVKVKQTPINADPTSWLDYSEKGDYVSRLEIYTASFNNGSWSQPAPFVYNNADVYSIGHPAISPDGNILYFASDMPGGYGETDIYYCRLNDDNTWSAPKNAGPTINTEGKEVFPYVAEDGHLFFSSNGHAGMGGLDLFEAVGSMEMWAKPQNLRYPINSPKDDFSIVFTKEGSKGFLASNREGGKGDDDIYSFELMPPQNLTIVAVTKEKIDAQTNIPLRNVNIAYLDKNTGKSESFTTDNDGRHIRTATCNDAFKITADKEGFLADTKILNTKCTSYNDTMFVELVLDKIIIGKPYAIKNIFYNFDKYDIRDDAKPELDNIVNIMTENPKINIELGSHTDSRGTKPYNNWLSQKRAESAVAYIISKGIDQSRITAKGYGETELINECADGIKCSDESHQMNRRTEFKITGVSRE